ncbi:MAG: hypothetical protein GF364_19045 [Candidatus Lokiarchaeota archaeon]|nr:hypothetical protein [Candidatus Lokiarchaeota archaeon]
MPKKKVDDWEDDYYDDEADEVLEEYFSEEPFKCRVCGKEVTVEDGDDYVKICDECAENYNMDKLWNDYDVGKLTDEDLAKVDLEKYRLEE